MFTNLIHDQETVTQGSEQPYSLFSRLVSGKLWMKCMEQVTWEGTLQVSAMNIPKKPVAASI